MNLKNVTIVVALWTLLLAPLFCGLGVLVHACIDDQAQECHHEVECDADPCQVLVLAASQRNDDFPDHEISIDFPGLPHDSQIEIDGQAQLSVPTHENSDLNYEQIDARRTLPLIS